MEILGIRLVGLTPENGYKLLLTLTFIAAALLVRAGLRSLASLLLRGRENDRARFWTHQGVSLFTAVLLLVGVVSIWLDNPARLTTAMGLVTAGLAFALQRVITAVAAYFIILRGRTFSVGNRITMGGVRGDVIALGFMQTTIMEMGQPPAVQNADPAMWVKSRQYTGRIVSITNDKIFDQPVYNYTRDYPFVWEELSIGIGYQDDYARAERILLEAATRHSADVRELASETLQHLERRYALRPADLAPHVYYRITDNWLELTVRFAVRDYGMRDVKDAMSREILVEFRRAGIEIASATYDIVGIPDLNVKLHSAAPAARAR